MSNIKKFKTGETAWLHLKNAEGDLMYGDDAEGRPDPNKPMRICAYGPGSKPYAKAQAQRQNRMVMLLKKRGKTDQSAEEKAEDVAKFLTAVTHSTENIEYPPYAAGTEEMLHAMYGDQEIGFVAEQVNEFVGDWANFPNGSGTT
jgi:hypothetical protein